MDEVLHVAREIHDGMGGIGYSLEHLQEPSQIRQYIKLFDEYTVNHQEGRPRPASNAVTVSIDNPGMTAILKEAGHTKVTNLNVGLTESFMEKVKVKDFEALKKLRMVAESIHRTGQPALLFVDSIPSVALEENSPFAANVCGESPLAADESALLGSLNLVKFVKETEAKLIFDEKRFADTVKIGVRFLDGMHDIHEHSSPYLKRNTLATRKIGVGIMGFAHMLVLLGIRYGSEESIRMAEKIGKLLRNSSEEESIKLGEKGASIQPLVEMCLVQIIRGMLS